MKITYKDKTIEIQEPQKVIDVFKDVCNEHIIACICNNQIQSLNHILKEDTNIKFIDISDKDGLRIYMRGLSYIMAKAFSEVYPKALLTVDYQLSNSMFCDIIDGKVTDEFIEALNKETRKIVKENIPIKQVIMNREQAIKFYNETKTSKGRLQIDLKENNEIFMYYCEDYYNYC